jgi:hypothetical protein
MRGQVSHDVAGQQVRVGLFRAFPIEPGIPVPVMDEKQLIQRCGRLEFILR